MGHDRTWIIPVFIVLLIILAVLPKVIDFLKRRRFMRGSGDRLFEPRMFETVVSEDTVREALSDKTNAEILVFSCDIKRENPLMTFYKIRKKTLQLYKPVSYEVKFLGDNNGRTVFEVSLNDAKKYPSSRYETYINEFFSVKTNAYRVFYDKDGNLTSVSGDRA